MLALVRHPFPCAPLRVQILFVWRKRTAFVVAMDLNCIVSMS